MFILGSLLAYPSELHAELLNTIYTLIPQQGNSWQVSYYLQILPYLEPQQQAAIIEQAWRSTQRIDTIWSKMRLQLTLIPYLAQTEQQSAGTALFQFASKHNDAYTIAQLTKILPNLHQQIYQYLLAKTQIDRGDSNLIALLPANQQQDLANRHFQRFLQNHSYNISDFLVYLNQTQLQQFTEIIIQDAHNTSRLDIFAKLISLENYPSQQLLPYIANLTNLSQRVSLLNTLLKHTAVEQQHTIEAALKQSVAMLIDETTPDLIDYTNKLTSEQYSKIWDLHRKIEPKLNILEQLPAAFQASIQVKQQLAGYLREAAYPIQILIQHQLAFECCVAYFDQPQIQAVLHAIESHEYHHSVIAALVPYLNQDQLSHLQQLLSNTNDLYMLRDFYLTAQHHHKIFQNQSQYQTLIDWLQRNQLKHEAWEWFMLFKHLAPYLDDTNYQPLLYTTLNRLQTLKSPPDDSYFINTLIENIVERKLYNQQTIQILINYAAQQERETNFQMLAITLAPYLKTLEPEQAQELASQINHSIDQVVNCWP